MASHPAVFLDRDGVINKEKAYVHRIEDFEFIDGVFEACKQIQQSGYKIIIITNQAGIGRGYYTESDFEKLNTWMLEKFKNHGVTIDAVYYCPHHPTEGLGDYLCHCDCRKPEPGLLKQAIIEHDINPEASVVIGDKLSDLDAGKRAGIKQRILVRSGHPIDESGISEDIYIIDNLLDAARSFL